MSLHNLDNWMDAHLEAYLDGDLSAEAHRRFEKHLAERPDWQRELRRARTIREGLRDIPVPSCPPSVMENVRTHSQGAGDRPPVRHAHDRTRRRIGWKPLVAAALLIVTVTLAPLVSPAPDPSQTKYTRAEIREAAAELRWTLAYVSHVTEETQQTIRHDVLKVHVAAPLQKAFAPLFSPNTKPTES